MELSARIKEERKQLGLSQEALADKLHVSRQAISKWERGESYPDLEKLIAFSDIAGITLDELIKGDKRLESKLVNDGGRMSGRSILGYVLIVIGILTGFWGGSMYTVSLMDEAFMSFLIGAALLVTVGILLIKDIPNRIVLAALYLTFVLSVIYMISLDMDLWVTLIGITVLIGLGWWLTIIIIDKRA